MEEKIFVNKCEKGDGEKGEEEKRRQEVGNRRQEAGNNSPPAGGLHFFLF